MALWQLEVGKVRESHGHVSMPPLLPPNRCHLDISLMTYKVIFSDESPR
jgi:hypothetical protein